MGQEIERKFTVKGDFKQVNAKHIMDCAKKGDAISLDIVHRFVDTLGSAIASIINLLDPEIVAIGGSLSKCGEFLLAIKRRTKFCRSEDNHKKTGTFNAL